MNSRKNLYNHRSRYRMNVAWSLMLCGILLIGGFGAGLAVERYLLDEDESPQFLDLEAVGRIIDEDYYYQPTTEEGQLTMRSDMESGAIVGALDTLNDSYTRYLDADDSKTAQEQLDGVYGGIGIEVSIDGGLVFVQSVVPNSPADQAGILRGDVIEQIDGERPPEEDRNEVLRMLRGEPGDTITVTFIRPSNGEVIQEQLTLVEIQVPPVSLEFLEGGRIAWIRITLFGSTTDADLDAAIQTIRDRGAEAVILDLRGNGGGYVEAARKTIGRFIEASTGPALYEDTEPGDGGMHELEIVGPETAEVLDLPMVVLVDGSTASASEIVAGALKDYNRAPIVGETTFGKGSVQRIYAFSDGSTMRVTVAEWFTPSKGRIQSEGIRPDVHVAATSSTDGGDAILDAGIRLLLEPAEPAATPAD